MEPWIAAVIIPCSLLAGLFSGALVVRHLFLPSSAMKESLEDLERVQKKILLVDLPRTEQAAEAYLERAEALLQSAETKRRRAAAAASKAGNGPDPEPAQEPWSDPGLSPHERRTALEAEMNRRGM